MNAKKADILLIAASLMWGSGYIGADIGLKAGLTPFQLISGRFIIASCIMLIVFNKHLKETTKHEIKCGIILGLFTAMGFAFQTVGLVHTSVSNNAFLISTNVAIVPFLYWAVAKVKPDAHSIIGVIITIIGIALLTLNSSLKISRGDFITLLGAVSYACNMVAVGRFLGKGSPMHVTFIQFVTVAISMSILMPFEGAHAQINATGFMTLLYLATIATVLTYLIQNYAFKYTIPTKGSIILSTESVFGTILSVIILHESLAIKTIIGSLVIFSAIIFTEAKPKLPQVSIKVKKFISAFGKA